MDVRSVSSFEYGRNYLRSVAFLLLCMPSGYHPSFTPFPILLMIPLPLTCAASASALGVRVAKTPGRAKERGREGERKGLDDKSTHR